ncbi:MAG: MurR/RpiR family transcriptional regulator [Chloroflexi bacterium]|nr:MurR/RpiR family transcriptional regulator [Chloroflexota bacterium]
MVAVDLQETPLQGAVGVAFAGLAPKQQRVARFMAANEALIAFTSASEVARRLGVDPATVVRLARALGFKGYPDLQRQIRARIPHHYPSLEARSDDAGETSLLERAIAQGQRNLGMTLEGTTTAQIDEVVERLAQARRVVVFGSGVASGLVQFLASSLTTIGVAAEGEIAEGLSVVQRLAQLDGRDLAIGVGFYRYVRQTVRALAEARDAGVPCVAITDSPLSPLAPAADVILCAPVESISHRVSLVGPCALADTLIAAYADRFPDAVAASLRRLDERYRAAGLLANS